jgi:transglutaminase-like putative cysteine protease
MQRRDFIKSMAAAGAIAAVGRRAHAAPKGWREFEITFRISIKDPAAPVRLWVPVPQDALDYQQVVDIGWRSPVTAHVLWEGTSRAPIVSTAWPDLTTAREVEITARVMTRDRSGFYSDASREELAEYLRPTPSSPTDGIVLAKAREIVAARTVPLDKARAIYDWVVDNAFRRAETRGCGLGNVAFMLESGDLGGKVRRHQFAVCRARAGGGAAGARLLRHPRRRLESVKIARQIRRHHHGAALSRRGLHRWARLVAGRPRRCA